MQRSPFTPGDVARRVFGRTRLLRDVRVDLMTAAMDEQLIGRLSVFVGPRGVGNTSLLRTIQTEATEKYGFATAWVTSGDAPLNESIAEALRATSDSWASDVVGRVRSSLERITIQAPGVSAEFNTRSEPIQSPGRLVQNALTTACTGALESGHAGLVLLIDEIQEADSDGLRALAYAWQHMQNENADLPLVCLTAGLSNSQDVITEAVSFAERFKYTYLGNLDQNASQEVLAKSTKSREVGWYADALDAALEESKGYPYFLQLVGDCIWKAAGYPDPEHFITLREASEGLADFQEESRNFHRARWMKATPAEEEFLIAMAKLGGDMVPRAEIARAMGKESSAISMPRQSLIDKGIIDSPSHGYLSFSAPSFAEYIVRDVLGEA